jgi:hypothetical protein
MGRKALAALLLSLISTGCASRSVRRHAEPDDAAGVLRAALHHALVDPRDLRDWGLVEHGPEIVVRSEIPNSPFHIGERELPAVAGRKLLLLSMHDIEARAARHKGDVFFVSASDLKLVGEDAELIVGVELFSWPRKPTLCCCSARVRYVRVGGTWTYRDATDWICS